MPFFCCLFVTIRINYNRYLYRYSFLYLQTVRVIADKMNDMSDSKKLNRYDSTPLYAQLHTIIRNNISSGTWAPDNMIPSENELSRLYGVSRMTVRNVITQFVNEGLMYRIQGKGTFVSSPKIEISGLHYTGIRSQLEEMGHSVTTSLLSCDIIRSDERIASKLMITPGEEVYCVKRIRTTNGVNISYHESYVPVRLCPDLEKKPLIDEQLCTIISNDYLLSRSRVEETLESFTADEEKADYLNIYPGFPLILLEDKIYSPDNVLFEYTRVYFRGDKVKIRIEYNE